MSSALRNLRTALGAAEPREVSVGYQTVRLYAPSVLSRRQVGYSRDAKGKSLTGTRPGAWRDDWFVIGDEDMCGDPIFVDLSKPEFPVFTAMHGTGHWEPTLIARSFRQFVSGLKLVRRLSRGRASPVALEANPLTRAQRTTLRRNLRRLGSGIDLGFWMDWFDFDE